MTATPRVYLLDVEGTVAPISLVSEQLFPYARAHFERFLWENVAEMKKNPRRAEEIFSVGSVWWDVMMLVLENRAEADPDAPRILPGRANDPGAGVDPKCVSMSPAYAIPRVLNYVFWLMDRDRKSTALKSLQGKIWKAGFESGELKGTLFADVPAALERWSARGRVAIYSSGSASAQQLLFRHSIFGDLTGMIAAYFDTRTGVKTASASYTAIAAAIEVEPGEVCFFSDVVRELDPAREAGMETRLVVREGNVPVGETNGHVAIDSFEDCF